MTMRAFTRAELRVSPLNVRMNREDAEATSALEASILAHGLLFPLVVHPMTLEQSGGEEGLYGVLAGGRRFRAIGRLIEAGKLPADYAIDAAIRDLPPAEITELSLSENLLRRELRPYEVHAAIARAADQCASAEDIAARTGQRPEWVRQQLRLGHLAPEIFDAYANERLSIEDARAYAATEDQELQRVAWAHFKGRPSYEHNARAIRAFLKVGDRELEKLLRFVGEEDYRVAGGRFEFDLFADGPEERGRVVDETKLRQLAEARLDQHRERIRTRTGRKDLRFAKEPPQNSGTTDFALQIEPQYRGKHRIDLPAGDIVATLTISAGGEIEVGYWFASRKAKADAKKVDSAAVTAAAPPTRTRSGLPVADNVAFQDRDGQYAQAARAAVKDEHGLTADGLQVVRSLRRTLLRALLVSQSVHVRDGTLGRDYLVWSLARQELGGARDTETGTRGLVSVWGSRDDEPLALVKGFLEDEDAAAHWTAMVEELARLHFMTLADPAESLAAYVELSEESKNVVAAVLAGVAMLRSANVPGWRIAAHDKLAELAGGDDTALRELWQPSPAFLALFPKLKRLELAQPFVGAAEFQSWHKLPDKVLTGACAGAIALDPSWVHPLLSFNVSLGERPSADEDDGEPCPNEQDPDVNDAAGPRPQMMVRAQ